MQKNAFTAKKISLPAILCTVGALIMDHINDGSKALFHLHEIMDDEIMDQQAPVR